MSSLRRCEAVARRSGLQCKKSVNEGERYCGIHALTNSPPEARRAFKLLLAAFSGTLALIGTLITVTVNYLLRPAVAPTITSVIPLVVRQGESAHILGSGLLIRGPSTVLLRTDRNASMFTIALIDDGDSASFNVGDVPPDHYTITVRRDDDQTSNESDLVVASAHADTHVAFRGIWRPSTLSASASAVVDVIQQGMLDFLSASDALVPGFAALAVPASMQDAVKETAEYAGAVLWGRIVPLAGKDECSMSIHYSPSVSASQYEAFDLHYSIVDRDSPFLTNVVKSDVANKLGLQMPRPEYLDAVVEYLRARQHGRKAHLALREESRHQALAELLLSSAGPRLIAENGMQWRWVVGSLTEGIFDKDSSFDRRQVKRAADALVEGGSWRSAEKEPLVV